jgi:hypothetical protein
MAYTKYSLTPANNNAAPPDGAPEGMLPSAVNDTMRDMMAQIRDVGDGIRGGTYTMTAPVITGGSVTGSTINNSAIGGTTAAAGKFTTLEATGVTTVQAGTVSAPAITTTGDTNTGIFFPAADTIAFTEGGVEAMRINASGNLGIGTSSPSVNTGIGLAIFGAAGQARIALKNNSTGDTAADGFQLVIGTDSVAYLEQREAAALILSTSATDRVRIEANGDVGIGSGSASSKLNLTGSADQTIQVNGSGTAAFLGTSTSIAQISSNRNPTTGAIYDSGRAVSYINLEAGNGNSNIQFFTSPTNNVNATERMRIDKDGVLSFNSGYGSVGNAYGCRAWVNFNGTGTVAILASGNVSSITDGGVGLYQVNFTNSMPDASYATVVDGQHSTSAIFRITPNGTYQASAVQVDSTDSLQTVRLDAAIFCVSVFR